MKPVTTLAVVLTALAVLGCVLGYLGPYWPGMEDAGVNFGAAFLYTASLELLVIVAIVWIAVFIQKNSAAAGQAGGFSVVGFTAVSFIILGLVAALGSLALLFFAPAENAALSGLFVVTVFAAVELFVVGLLLWVALKSSRQLQR